MLPEALAPASTRADAEWVARLALEAGWPQGHHRGSPGRARSPLSEGSSTGAAAVVAGGPPPEQGAASAGRLRTVTGSARRGDRYLEGNFARSSGGTAAALNLQHGPVASRTPPAPMWSGGRHRVPGFLIPARRPRVSGCSTSPPCVAGDAHPPPARLAHIRDDQGQSLAGTGTSGVTLVEALFRAREHGAASCQVEVESLVQVEAACAAGADPLLIDNQSPYAAREWTLARRLRPGIDLRPRGSTSPTCGPMPKPGPTSSPSARSPTRSGRRIGGGGGEK